MKLSQSRLFRTKSVEGTVESALTSKLRKCLTLSDLVAIGLGDIIGAGAFTVVGVVIRRAGPSSIFSTLLSGLCVTFTALCYAEFAKAVPSSGSAYSYIFVSSGELPAWLVGWMLMFGYAVGNSALARSWASYFQVLLRGGAMELPEWLVALEVGSFKVCPLSALFLISVSLLLLLDVKHGSGFNWLITVSKIGIILMFVIVGFSHADPANWQDFAPGGGEGIIAGAAQFYFAYLGFDAITVCSEEAHDAERDTPRAIYWSLGLSGIIYGCIVCACTLMQPALEVDAEAPLSAAMLSIGYPLIGSIVSVGALLGMTSAVLVTSLALPRIMFAISRDGLLPAQLTELHPTYQTPLRATGLSTTVGALFALVFSLEVLMDMLSLLALTTFNVVILSYIVMRFKENAKAAALYSLAIWGGTVLCSLPLLPLLLRLLPLPVMLLLLLLLCRLPQTQHAKSFSMAGFPYVPVLGLSCNSMFMAHASAAAWLQLGVLLLLGLLVYFCYGHQRADPESSSPVMDESSNLIAPKTNA